MALGDTGASGRSPWVRSEREPEIARRVGDVTGEEVPWGCALVSVEGRSPLARAFITRLTTIV